MRRNRWTPSRRALIQETHLHPSQLVAPLFVHEKPGREIVHGIPAIFRSSIDELLKEVEELQKLGVTTINIFGFTEQDKKDPTGTEAYRKGNIMQRAIQAVKMHFPDVVVMAYIALDLATSHGHDGVIDSAGNVLNDETVVLLGEMSLRAAEAGVDYLSPSDMMDGRVGYLRQLLDQNGYFNVGILSYAAKLASAFYGPFRDIVQSGPKIGDKKNYQLNPANQRESLLECLLDDEEGADLLLIKPATTCLDIISKLRETTLLPIGAYHVSGEYAMIVTAAERGFMDHDRALMETLISIRRAGADFIFTYAARHAAHLLKKGV
jgi:porphobilinogen synthase